MASKILKFMTREDGAVTVDWVVLTAAVIVIAFAVFQNLREGAIALDEAAGAEMTAQSEQF